MSTANRTSFVPPAIAAAAGLTSSSASSPPSLAPSGPVDFRVFSSGMATYGSIDSTGVVTKAEDGQYPYLSDLLKLVATNRPGPAADGTEVTFEARQSDITRLQPDDLADATLITASALLDMLTDDELARMGTSCVGAGCPTLLTLSVVGWIELSERLERAGDCRPRREVTAHGVQRDPSQGYASRAATRCSPA